MVAPLSVDRYENNDVALEVHEHQDGRTIWLQSGVGAISFDEKHLKDLHTLVDAYLNEAAGTKRALVFASAVVLLVLLFFFLAPLV